MGEIYELDRTRSIGISQELFNNAEVLIETGHDAAVKNNYGVAISLSILGAEEFIKGIIMYLFGTGVNVFEIKEIKKAFYNHKRKHEFANLLKVLDSINKINTKEMKFKSSKTKSKNKLKSVLKSIINILVEFFTIYDQIKWWEKADELKMKGFYVDYRNGSIISPKIFTKKDYTSVISMINQLKESFKSIQTTLEDDHTKKQFINDFNLVISNYVNKETNLN